MTAVVTEMNPRPKEFVRSLKPDIYQVAHKRGRSFTAWLETQKGIRSSEFNDGLDAYERLLYAEGIRINSDEANGIWADPVEAFGESEQRKVLFPEFLGRNWRAVSLKPRSQQRAVYTTTDNTVGSLARPYADALTPRTDLQIAPAIPLSELIATTTVVAGREYRAYYLLNNAANQRMVRVGESAPLPRAKLIASDNTVGLYKFGRSLEASYESLRYMRVDRLAMHIRKMAVQTEVDQVAAALDVLVNGDGNSGTAAQVYNNTTLDTGATAGTLRIQGWLAFKMKFANPYTLTTALMREATALQLALLNAGSANVPLANLNLGGMVQSLIPINMTADGVRYGWTSDAPSLKIVGFDKRFALERVVEAGSEISEVMRWINVQTEELTMSMSEGYAVIDPSAALVLDVNA